MKLRGGKNLSKQSYISHQFPRRWGVSGRDNLNNLTFLSPLGIKEPIQVSEQPSKFASLYGLVTNHHKTHSHAIPVTTTSVALPSCTEERRRSGSTSLFCGLGPHAGHGHSVLQCAGSSGSCASGSCTCRLRERQSHTPHLQSVLLVFTTWWSREGPMGYSLYDVKFTVTVRSQGLGGSHGEGRWSVRSLAAPLERE